MIRSKQQCVFALALVTLTATACGPSETQRLAAELTGGDPDRGREMVRYYGCHTCHTIPRVQGAGGKVGPPLGGIANRAYLAGRLPNTPPNMVHWIQSPRSVDPETIMPNVGVTEQDARDIAGFLYTLE